MKIGIDGRYAEGELSGIGKYIKELALRLSKRGLKIVVFYSQKPKNKISGKNISSIILPSKNRYVFEQFLLPRVLLEKKIKLYHAAGNIGVPLFCPCPSVLTVHDIIPLLRKGYFKNSRFWLFSKLSYFLRLTISVFKADRIIADSEFTKNSLVKRLKVKPSKIEVIYLGISARKKKRVVIKNSSWSIHS